MKLFAVITLFQLVAFCAYATEPVINLKEIVEKSIHTKKAPLLNPLLEGKIPPLINNGPVAGPLTPPELEEPRRRRRRRRSRSSNLFGDNVNLNWVKWDGSLPQGAVGIYNGYSKRSDYVCKYKCDAGFYTPSKGPYCNYPYGDKEYHARTFEVLVNVDNFEVVEWKEGSFGSVPENAIRTCGGVGTFVGKNKYGLGKVVPKFTAFFLPWEGDEYWYKYYEVLAINRDVYSQHISHVEYGINEVELFHYPPETMRISSVANNDCQTITKTVTFSKTTEVENTWNIGRTTMLGVTAGITAEIPMIGSSGVKFTAEKSLQLNRGTTLVEALSHELSVKLTVPPNHSCTARMEGRKMTAGIPFKARLSRTYANGETQWTSIIGVYGGIQIEVRAMVDRCEPIIDSEPCPSAL
ncbi:natterin-3-like [Tachysurus fulvidraco]|uniref:natterin-3-like n=1 Tax=Tachysurus fulvidraco TaxID=1234273 RepID=UPI001FEECDFE|nr:natterin-3-like [Tachysurus fulvidraco]